MPSLNGQQAIDKFTNMVGDALDPDFALQLVNDAKDEVELDVYPSGLVVVNTSASTFVGQTHTTGIALPANFLLAGATIWVGTFRFQQIPFERAFEYRDVNGYFYINPTTNTYHLTGRQTQVETITFPYQATSAALTVGTSPTWPTAFHGLIPLKMAELYYAIDAGEKSRAWDDRWAAQYQRGLNRFRDYDAKQKLAALGGRAGSDFPAGENGIYLN